MPGTTSVGRDFKRLDSLVGVNDLHAEPVGGDTVFVGERERRGDGAIDVRPGDVDDARGRIGDGSKGVGKEVELVGAAAWTFVDNLSVLD